MATLDSLPADQRAVLQLVLGRGRSYDDIGSMLSIERAAVRERALGALDALGPDSEIDTTRRGLITDYLLGQLPPQEAADVRSRLAERPDERAWARIVAGELVPLGADRLPEIPAAAGASRASGARAAVGTSGAAGASAAPGASSPAAAPDPAPAPVGGGARTAGPGGLARGGRTSRRGGALLLGAGLLVIVAVILVVLLTGGSSHKRATTASTPGSAATTSTAATSSASATATAKPIAQVNLTSPSGAKTPGGAAVVVRQGAQTGLVIRAVGLPANTKHDAYAVWLSTPSGPNQILGFVNPAVGTTGILQTAGVLPAAASRFTQLLVTLETQAKPKSPGKIVLQGALKLSG